MTQDNQNKTRKRLLTPSVSNPNEIGKLPPQAIELEEAVLGAMLLEREALSTVIDILSPEAFYKEQNGRVFAAMIALFNRSEPVDILTVTQELKRTGVVSAIGLGVNEKAVLIDVMGWGEWDAFLLAGRYTLLEQGPLDDLLPMCVTRGTSNRRAASNTWKVPAALV